MKAWYESENFKTFAAEVDEWQASDEAKDTKALKAPLKSFRQWRRKKLQGKRQQQKLADRERAKAEKMAAKMKAKADKSAAKPGKKGKARNERMVIVMVILLFRFRLRCSYSRNIRHSTMKGG